MIIRPYRKEDAERIVTWFKDEKSFYNWCADKYDHFPITPKEMNDYYDKKEDDSYHVFSFEENGELVGHLTLGPHENDKSNYCLGFVVIDINKRNRGLGKEMTKLVTDYCFEKLDSDKVYLWVFADNDAKHMYESAGFRKISEEIYLDRLCYEMVMEK